MFWVFFQNVESEQHLSSMGCSTWIHKAGSGLQGEGSGRGGVLLAGQTGFGVWSVRFVLRAAAEIIIHLETGCTVKSEHTCMGRNII